MSKRNERRNNSIKKNHQVLYYISIFTTTIKIMYLYLHSITIWNEITQC